MRKAPEDPSAVLREVHDFVHDALPREQHEQHEQHEQQHEVGRRRRSWWRRRSSLSARDRLVAKALGSLHDRLAVAQRLRPTPQASHPNRLKNLDASLRQAHRMLQYEDRKRDEDAIWLLDFELRCALVEMGDVGYLRVCVDEELRRDPTEDPAYLRLDAEQLRELGELRDQFANQNPEDAKSSVEPDVERAVQVLIRRYHQREHAQRHERARNARRGQLLTWVAAGLTGLVVLLALVIWRGLGISWPVVGVVLLSAMLGSAIGGARKLRDELLRIGELDAFPSAFLAQLAVGAGLGLVVLLLLDAGMLPRGKDTQPSPSTFAVYAFAAGFSEPFVIGVVQRLAATDSKPR